MFWNNGESIESSPPLIYGEGVVSLYSRLSANGASPNFNQDTPSAHHDLISHQTLGPSHHCCPYGSYSSSVRQGQGTCEGSQVAPCVTKMEVVSPGANGVPPTNSFTSMDPNLVVQHLSNVLEVTLGASRMDLEAPGSLLSKLRRSDTIQRCTRFASESQVALYVQKDVVSADQANGTNGINCSSGMTYRATGASGKGTNARRQMRRITTCTHSLLRYHSHRQLLLPSLSLNGHNLSTQPYR